MAQPFRYESFVNPYARDIADSIAAPGRIKAQAALQAGDANARAELQSGAAWGSAIHNIGQVAAGAVQQVGEAKRQITLQGIIKDTPKVDLGDGVFGYDLPSITETTVKHGGNPADVTRYLGAINESLQQAHTARMGAVQKGAAGLRAAGNDPVLAGDFLDLLERNHVTSSENLKQFRELAQTPEGVAKLTAFFAGPQKMERGAPGTMAIGPDGKPIEGSQVPDKPQLPTQASLAAAAAAGDPQAQAALDKLRPAPEAKKFNILVPGPEGRPMNKLVTEDELAKGIPAYRDPKGPKEDQKFWVFRDGKPLRVSEGEYRPGDLPGNTREQGRPVTSGDAGRMADFDTSLSDLKVLNTTLTETKGATGTAAAIGAGMPAWATDTFGWGVDAKKRQGVIDRVKQVIGKTLEGGVLRKEDEYKYEKILPTIKDTAEVAKAKLAGLETAITQRRSTFLDALGDAGFETGKFSARTAANADPMRTKAADILTQAGHASDAAAVDLFLKNNPTFK